MHFRLTVMRRWGSPPGLGTMFRTTGIALLLSVMPPRLEAQWSGQSFAVTPEVSSAQIGDTVPVRFRLRLDERDLLYDTMPRPVSPPVPGVRILSVEKLRRRPDRIFEGRALMAFYRPGRQALPVFGLPFMRAVKGLERATVTSDTASIDIVAILPAGNPSLKDIKPLEPVRGPGPVGILVAGILALGGALGVFRVVRRTRRGAPSPEPPAAEAGPFGSPDPYQTALERLAGIEREGWPARGEADRHYQAIVDVLRGYLRTAEGLPAFEYTTSQLLGSLPAQLDGNGLRERCGALLGEADLVKFAGVRPNPAMSTRFLQRTRDLLAHWHTRPR